MLRFRLIAAILLALLLGSPVFAQTDPDAPETALAARMAEMAQNTLRRPRVTDATWRSAVDLFHAAARLQPTEPRYQRLLLDAQLRVGDTAAAIDTARALLALEPANQVAQVQLIDLYLSRMQTADASVAYLRDLLGKPSIPAEVRSQVAVRLANLLLEQSQPDAARDLLSQALRLNPLNPQGLQLRYRTIHGNGALERVSVLLDMLKSNPAQPAVMAELADELAGVGLIQPALNWYAQTLNWSPKLGRQVSQPTAANYAAELFLSDQGATAAGLVAQMLQLDPTDPDAWMLQLAMEKADAAPDFPQTLEKARVALTARLGQVIQPTTQPASAPAPAPTTTAPALDLAKQIQRVRESNQPDVAAAYRSALTDMAWLELYFAQKPDAAAKYVDALRTLSPEDSVSVARLEGWSFLLQGKAEAAHTKLSAVADRDPLAALGMLRLDAADPALKDKVASQGRKLLSDNPSTLVAALIYGDLRDQGVKIVPSSQADAIQERLHVFPMSWMRILEAPETFYAIRCTPLHVAHPYGEPMLAKVSIINLTDNPLTIGDDGILHPDLWIDANLRGMAQQQMPGVAFDRLAKVLVLQPRQQVSQVVRIDQGALAELFAANPGISIQVFASLTTNPMSTSQGFAPGAGGYSVQFSRIMERTGTPLNTDETRRSVVEQATTGDSAARMRGLELAAAYVQIYTQQNDPRFQSIVNELLGAVQRGESSGSPIVAAWSRYVSVAIDAGNERVRTLERMLNSPQWFERLLGVVAAGSLPVAQLEKLVGPVAGGDSDPLVKSFAVAAIQSARQAATQPTTAPTTRP